MAKTADEMNRAAVLQKLIRGAFARARERVALAHYLTTNAGGYDVYAVGSSTDPDTAYTVTVDGAEQYRCTCPSETRPACWHRAAVYVRRANDRARAEALARAEARPAAA
jgi:uncharacterized Zn finger protein